MTAADRSPPAGAGRFAANLLGFGRLLRAAGLPVGTGKVLDAVDAVTAVGIGSRTDLYWTLHAVFVNRAEHRPVFDQAFDLFWRNPDLAERLQGLPAPQGRFGPDPAVPPAARRLLEALRPPAGAPPPKPGDNPELRIDARLAWSERERLQQRDFEAMSLEELAQAKDLLRRLRLPVPDLPTRRFAPHARGTALDLRRTLRQSVRMGGDGIDLVWRRRRTRPPPLVAIVDISGSMERYARMLLHFLHAVTNDRDRVHTFLFGTRLTNVSRHLRHRDVDVALQRVAGAVGDWSGGTRIGACLEAFNRCWGRRVLGQGAAVLLITDGLDRDSGAGLAAAMERLHRSCRKLIWLNPLLRFAGFAPRASGVRAMLPHVDDFRPVHNLSSLTGLAASLDLAGPRRGRAMVRRPKETA